MKHQLKYFWMAVVAVLAGLAIQPSASAEKVTHAELSEPPIEDYQREHWSFLPLQRPAVPTVEDSGWAVNPIDQFVLARLERKKIRPQPAAETIALVRRVTLDLTGLPPTLAELDQFLADRAPDAYERLVDRLLAAPAFGEHYAQFWLDLARFAETDGFEHDKLRPEAWKYRDWVIEALNRDLPYDQFVALQLAGDELQPDDAWSVTATGFCLAGPDMPDINLQAERRHTVLNDLTSTVGAVFLGLQFGCAQCHDHKFDPISQADFYRLRAIFEPAVDFKHHVLREGKPKHKPSFLYVRGDFREPGPEVQPAFPRIVNLWNDRLALPEPNARSTTRRAQLAQWLTRPDHPLTSRVMANRLWQLHFGRGLSASPSDLGVMGDEPIHDGLLDWLAVELVENQWSMKHLHRLLVTSATYRQASRPSGPDDKPWKTAVELDPTNLYWSRFPRRRLSGEALRDMMLILSDSLNRTQHGESVRPPLPAEVVQTLLGPNQWRVSPDKSDHVRRSIYIFARRNLRFPFFEAFDRPTATASCPRRNTSTIAPQSLMLLNSEFSLDSARRIAESVTAAVGSEPQRQIERVYRLALSRLPTDEELADARQFLSARQRPATDGLDNSAPESQASGSESAATTALTDFCLALLNSSEFVYIE